MPNFNDTNFDSSKLKRGSILYSAKISPTEEGKYALFNAYNISWEGYKMYDHTFTYTGDVLSYIESQLDLKSTADGEVWDNIKNNTITSQITIYTSSNSTTPPSITWSGDTALDDKYDDYTTYNALPINWARQIENIPQAAPHVFMSTIYEVRKLDNTLVGYHDPHGTVIYLPGESGLNGNFKSTVFVRSSIHTPDTPAHGANYNTGLPNELYAYINAAQHTDFNRISYNNGTEFKCWSDGIPAGNETLWATTAVITDTNPNDAEWTTPRQMTDTETYDVEFAYKYVNNNGIETTPPIPDNTNSGTGSTVTNKIWYDPTNDPSADWTKMYWRAERTCVNGVWNDWIIIRIKGEQGTVGLKGDFTSTVFKRSNTKPSAPTGGEYNNPVPTGWSDGIPNETGPVWSSSRTFTFNNDNNSEWSDPALVADTPTYDVEFSPYSNDSNTGPRTTKNIDTSDDWFDPTTDVTLPNDLTWEDMIWRAERNRATSQDPWSAWVITKIKGEDGTIPQPMDYYQTRYTSFPSSILDSSYWLTNNNPANQSPDATTLSVTANGTTVDWNSYASNTVNTDFVWQTSRRVTWESNNNTWEAKYSDDNWTTPFMLNGVPGEARPIQPVLLYQWYNSNDNAPDVTLDNTHMPGSDWKESPGNPLGTNKYLWMIQGMRKDGAIINWDIDGQNGVGDNEYWTTPICLSGSDGEPGKDGDDLEFIYCCPSRTGATTFEDDDNPATWSTVSPDPQPTIGLNEENHVDPQQDDYLGPDNIQYEWTDHPVGVSPNNHYEYCAYRRKTGPSGQKTWGAFSQPFPWSIFGENGIDGDGVEYIYYRTGTSPENITWTDGKNPSGWYSNTGDYQKDDYPCIENVGNWDNTLNSYVFRGWTDEPQGVGSDTNKKYEYVAIRKKGFVNGSVTTKEWKSFSNPKLWSNYAEDGRSINMVLETDNDNVTVGIDEHGKVNNLYQDNARISLNYNGIPQETSKYSLILSLENQTNVVSVTNDTAVEYNSSNIIEITTNENGQYVVSARIPQEFPLGSLNNVLIVVLTATTLEQIGDIPSGTSFTRTFKVSGVQLSIDDIYKLNLSTTTPHRTPDNEGFERMHITLNSFTSTSVLTTNADAKNKGLFVCYISTNGNTQENANLSTQIACVDNISDFELPSTYNKHTFYLKYNPAVISVTGSLSNYINNENTIQLDEEEATAVYDGANGVDSQSEEYIYLLTDDIDFFKNNTSEYYNVGNWKTNISSYVDNNSISYYQYNDYPFITNNNFITLSGTSTKYVSSIRYKNNSNSTYTANGTVSFIDNTNKLAIGYWTDNPQGVSEEYSYEFRVSRRYLTSATENDRWQAFGTPQPWANWGHTGEDGDGVEYIYRKMTDDYYSTTNTRDYNAPNNNYNPIQWCTSANYNTSEYILDVSGQDTWWTDNPQEVNDEYKYEYVSIRKYSTFSNNNFRKLIYNLPYLKDGSNNSTTYHIINDTDEDLNKYYGYLLTSTANLGTYKTLYSSLISYASSEHLTNNNENTLLHCAEQFMTAYNAYWSGSAPNYGWTNPKPYTNEKISRLCFYIYRNRNIINDNQKLWSPYYQPTLWAKYGEQGPQGDPGGSGLVFDFTNDNLQLGVNAKQTSGTNNGKSSIKGDNFTYTMINLYSGDELISYTEYKLTYTNNPIVVNGTHKLGYIFKHDNSNATTPNTYYASLTKTTDPKNYGVGNTSGWSNGYYFYIKTKDGDNLTDDKIYINDTQQIQFQITYNGKNYYKSVNVSTLHWGKDGEPAETFELFIPNSEIKIDAQGNTTPTSITPMVKHVRGGEMAEIISYSQLTTTYNTNGNFFTMGYLTNVLYASSEQTNPVTPKNVTSGTSSDSGLSTRGDSAGDVEKGGGTAVDSGSGLDLEDPTQQGSKIDDEEVTEKINGKTTGTVTYIGNGVNSVILGENFSDLEWVKYSLWYTESGTSRLIDEEVTYAISDGVNGRDGKYIEYIYYRPEGSEQINWNATGTWNGTTNPYIPNRNNSNFDNRANPSYWTVTNQSDWISDSYKGTKNWTIWTDNPSGIDSTYQWEYISQRTYDGENWSRYSIPQAWSHYGETGKDGDGVEYIYHVSDVERPISNNTTSTDTIAVPNTYNKDITAWNSFQQNEYGKNIIGWKNDNFKWTDDPTGVNESLSYEYVSTRKYKTVTDDNKSEFGTLTNGINIGSYVGKKLWFPFSEPTVWAKYGQKGPQGDPGTGSFELDWTNDQVNFGVDSTGKSNSGYKTTILNLITTDTSNSLKINNIVYDTSNGSSVNPSNSAFVTTQLANHTTTPDNGKIGWCYYFNNNKHYIYIRINKATIPQNGIDVTFAVDIYKNDSHLCWVTKTLRIFGQRNGQNGVSYELAISPNAISLASNGMLLNPTFNIGVIKYDGDTITNLTSSTLPENLSIQYSVGPTTVGSLSRKTASIGNDVTIKASGSNDIVFYLVTNDGANTFDIDVETIPVVRDGSSGGTGPQGFTGPIVRMRGEYVHNKNTYYGNGEYKKNTGTPQYDGTSPLYKDIVTYTWTTGTNAGKTKYYTPKSNITGSYITSSMSNSYLCTGSSYVHYQHPATSDGITNSMWVDATQYEFVATRLLYADQGLVNQLSTHDLIATDQNGYPVAGITSGAPKMIDKDGTEITSIISTGNNSGNSADDVHISSTDPVRIFAGEIHDETPGSERYSLTYAPFNVRQSGTAYMKNAYISGDITANTLSLGDGSFAYIYNHNDDQSHVVTLPELDGTTTKTFYILSTFTTTDYRYRIRCKNNYYISSTPNVVGEDMYISVGTGTTVQNSSGYSATPQSDYYKYICPKANTFYQCISVGKTWNIIITEITGPSSEYKYIDVTDDVTLYGYKYQWQGTGNNATSTTTISPYTGAASNTAWGPIIQKSNSAITMEFYTYIDTEVYGDFSTNDYALGDFGNYLWQLAGTV